MKLVNPAGRDVSTFDVQANHICRCICSTSSGHENAFDSSLSMGCACQCSHGSENNNANYSISEASVFN